MSTRTDYASPVAGKRQRYGFDSLSEAAMSRAMCGFFASGVALWAGRTGSRKARWCLTSLSTRSVPPTPFDSGRRFVKRTEAYTMTSNNLVPVFTGQLQDQPTTLCNARDLHATLGVGRDFTNWIKARIEEYGFTEGEDFVIDSPKRANQSGRGGDRRSRDYHLTLDMSKELAMVENNDKGRQVRRYFIEVEKKAKAPAITQAPALPSPSKITSNLRTRINKKAHALALEQYDTIHDLVETLVIDNLRCGATEPACEDYIERFGSSMGGVTMVNTCDLYQLARQTTGLLDKAGEALAVIHRLEKHTGMELYHRQGVTGLPDSLCKTVLGMIQQ